MNDDINKFSIGVPSEQIEPNIVFHAASNEVMRIDKRGITVNPAYSIDEATQLVLDALSGNIQHMVAQAVAAEREACAKVCEDKQSPLANVDRMFNNGCRASAAAIRARSKE